VKILGISGIDGSVAFKREHSPRLSAREHRMTQGHDSAASLIVDGEVVAAVAEERISRQKHTGDFPAGAIKSVLARAGLETKDLDEVVHAFDYGPYAGIYGLDPVSALLYRDVLSREAFVNRVAQHLPEVDPARIRHVDHHLAHAASAYYTSGWNQCLVVVIDGMGEAHGATIYRADNGHLSRVHRVSALDSIGIFYSLVTLHLGFDFNADEYKVMGLAPYGDPLRFRDFFEDAVRLRDNGCWEIPALKLERSREDRDRYGAARRHLVHHLGPERAPESEIDAFHKDVAAGLQACLDRAIVHLCNHFGEKLGERRLAMAGGVALNTTANARVVESGRFRELYVQPASGDDGAALGAALARAAEANEVVNRRSPTPFYGPADTGIQIRDALREFGDRIQVTPLESLNCACHQAATMIAAGEVIAWSRGRMEYGPRALGHRSILADPGRAEMRDRVNALVKLREAFRPFAPAVSIEQVAHWFDVAPRTSLPYMNVNVMVRTEHRSELPAVTHVDGSARVQTVSDADNSEFHTLLRAVGEHTGRELVLNTSFNVRGQPIVNSASEAISTFLSTGIQALFLDDTLIQRR
jgi:carbamoyltransferase